MAYFRALTSGGSGNANIDVMECVFYNVNGNSYIIHNGTTYNASGSPLNITVPNILQCDYQGSNTWKFTSLTDGKPILPISTNSTTNAKPILSTPISFITPPTGYSSESMEMWVIDKTS